MQIITRRGKQWQSKFVTIWLGHPPFGRGTLFGMRSEHSTFILSLPLSSHPARLSLYNSSPDIKLIELKMWAVRVFVYFLNKHRVDLNKKTDTDLFALYLIWRKKKFSSFLFISCWLQIDAKDTGYSAPSFKDDDFFDFDIDNYYKMVQCRSITE